MRGRFVPGGILRLQPGLQDSGPHRGMPQQTLGVEMAVFFIPILVPQRIGVRAKKHIVQWVDCRGLPFAEAPSLFHLRYDDRLFAAVALSGVALSIVALAGLSEGQLLERFVTRSDEAAFAALVGRHGPMVLGVCRRLLDANDADDAFQATFLILVRKAGTLHDRQRLGPWLYGVAHRVARRARSQCVARRSRERPETGESEPAVESESSEDLERR